ncbi:hypothetical protein LIER_28707 [Lithospermum erythrorhizon]|uniref:Uncharacterized protein n=1 Tax=Lithospermum erythrorhizon TaxID=34254 RepID=A0AAV3RGL1_LITER
MGHLIRQFPELWQGVDPRNECVYDLWIKGPMEKSWIVFSINDEPQDCLPRHLEVIPSFQTDGNQTDEGRVQHWEVRDTPVYSSSKQLIPWKGGLDEQLRYAHNNGRERLASNVTPSIHESESTSPKSNTGKISKGGLSKKRQHPYYRGDHSPSKKVFFPVEGLEDTSHIPTTASVAMQPSRAP